jgi:UDP-hydrolysing UDP-N-acetyl-D-glucosamine 2-epimerase
MKQKRKIAVVITARPSYSRIKTALKAIQDHSDLELQLVIAASALLDRYGSAVNYIEKDGFEISARVFMVLEGENPTAMAKTTGIGILELSTVFDNLQPDVVVTVADRFETMATAIAASYMNIPLAHIQGGEVTGNIDEKVRHAITKLADLHLVASDQAAERVLRMGEREGSIFVTGCPSIDLAIDVRKSPQLDFDPYQRYGGVGKCPDLSNGYIVVLQHPVTTEYDVARQQIDETLYALNKQSMPVLWFWPNVDAGADGTSNGIRTFRENHKDTKHMHFFKNMEGQDFLRLLNNASCLVGNSSVGIRECSFLGVPVVNIGSRQAGRQRGDNVVDVDLYERVVIEIAVKAQLQNTDRHVCEIYGDGQSGHRVADTLATFEFNIAKKLTY